MLPSTPKTLVLLAGWLCGAGTAAASEFTYHHENVMGTSLELRVLSDTEAGARWAEQTVLREIDRLSAILSGYDPSSEFRRWQEPGNSTSGRVSPELFEVLQASDLWRARSGGAFDPRVEALSRLWSQSARQQRLPSAEELARARALMTPLAWRLDPDAHTAVCLTACPLSLNAIAKGSIVDRACDAGLDRRQGIRGLLLNVGGDLRVCGESQETLGIASPRNDSETTGPIATITVRDRSVATSGNYHRGYKIQDHWYSHIFDPRSGMPVERTVSATVVAAGADADALATAFNVLTVEESLRLANALPDVECMLVTSDGRIARSAGWGRYESPRAEKALLATVRDGEPEQSKEAPARDWGDEFEVQIKFEIQGPDGNTRRYRRPYVVVWVEDKDGLAVRTLILWVQKKGRSQWVRDLLRWYRSDQARLLVDKTDVKGTLSRATRAPGQYEVVWDGKDDRGRSLGRGAYTIAIEAAREHGTYQSMRKAVTLDKQPFVEVLKGNVEIKSASVEYRRKGAPR